MSNYTPIVNFAAKDSLTTGDPAKVVKGTEISAEFSAIQAAISTKTDNSAALVTGGSINNTTIGATTPSTGAFTTLSASGAITSSGTAPILNLTDTTPTNGVNFRLSNGGSHWAYGEIGIYDVTNAQKAYAYSSVSDYHRHYINGTQVTAITSTGLAVTGTLSADGIGAAASFLGATTSNRRVDIGNTGQSINVGVESSTGGAIISGSSAYAGVVNTGGAYPLQFGTNSVLRATIDTSGNLGLGVTPSAWTAYTAFQIGANGSLVNYAASIDTRLTSGAYYSSGNWKYTGTTKPVQILLDGGNANFVVYADSVAGTAGTNTTNSVNAAGTQILGVKRGSSLAIEGASSVAGTGISFPAAQSASSDANTLDDYEEGTWTPSVGGTATYSFQGGVYTKIGRQVTVRGDLTINAIGTGSTTVISGLPFTSAADGFVNPGSVGYFSGSVTSVVTVTGYVSSGVTTFSLQSLTAAGAALSANAIFGAGTRVAFTATYFV